MLATVVIYFNAGDTLRFNFSKIQEDACAEYIEIYDGIVWNCFPLESIEKIEILPMTNFSVN